MVAPWRLLLKHPSGTCCGTPVALETNDTGCCCNLVGDRRLRRRRDQGNLVHALGYLPVSLGTERRSRRDCGLDLVDLGLGWYSLVVALLVLK